MKDEHSFQLLVQRYTDGVASAQEVESLNQRLRSDAEARRLFLQILNLDSALDALLVCGASYDSREEVLPVVQQVPVGRRRLWGYCAALAASLLIAVVCISQLAATKKFATVDNAAGVENLSTGMRLGAESYAIEAGSVELITARGARVAIEAPAYFYFESEQRLHLTRGRLAADVPPSAKGFTIITPNGKVIDLGTKFGVNMPDRGEAEIHVFQGEVIAQTSAGGKPKSLRDGEAFRMKLGAESLLGFRSAAFIHPGEVTSLQAGLAAGQRGRSESILEELRRDPALIALLDFEKPSPKQGVYRMVQGRWPGSQAAEFVNVGDHMKLDVGGEHLWPQLTLAAWVRLDHLGEPYQSLLHTDDWNKKNDGQVHWMVNRHTTMRLALQGNTMAPGIVNHEGFPDSRTGVRNELGRWVHLAVVYDADKKTARFYLNGKFDNEMQQAIAHPARLGPAQIGNWNQNDRKLSGRVDELLILGRDMNDDEIEALFAAGNPYR
ncbi:FecR domain-containing protein [Blastopirellula sp. J2-11]|uniref:LamG-like jellyroll fold domain-containing protein n=1 Tax=Blastopirellula sp. J2-11 TaxID=2943192 RepID=UPI0021CA4C02|nr:LamG-like jellyroll fold domain-containing protein [Blastopirellula sp. J2-11]UUO05775.1 FecR domain-containing protein [Blastopirellula sp. J2-11]